MFQFHFGTIDRKRQVYKSAGRCRFNSTLVRLIERPIKIVIGSGVFQFHFGTIDRKILAWTYSLIPLFQFHFGTIDSLFP